MPSTYYYRRRVRPPLPSSSLSLSIAAVRQSTARTPVPPLPECVVREILKFLDYRQLARVERVSRRWRNVVAQLVRLRVHELCVELYDERSRERCVARESLALSRLDVRCPEAARDFLRGVLRRSRPYVSRLTCHLPLLSLMDQLSCGRAGERVFWGSVEELWLVVLRPAERHATDFGRLFDLLFLVLRTVTLQVHAVAGNECAVARVLATLCRSNRRRPSPLDMSVELHANNADAVYRQLADIEEETRLARLKLICTSTLSQPRLCLSHVFGLLRSRRIHAEIVTFRDWAVSVEPESPLWASPLHTFRLSSCYVLSVDRLVHALTSTTKQARPKRKKAATVQVVRPKPIDVGNGTAKSDERKKKKVLKPWVRVVELAGLCPLGGYEYLGSQAHKEVACCLKAALPRTRVDTADIYYCD